MATTEKLGAVTMSNWQHTLMTEAVKQGGITLERMLQLRQTTAGSVIRRGYFRWDRNEEMFVLTPESLRIMQSFEDMDVTRKGTYLPLSSFIHDASAIKLAEARREELRKAARQTEKPERKRQGRASSNGHRRSSAA
jgi:hypothetical protein